MTAPADVLNTVSVNGRNLTPVEIIRSVYRVFPRINLDVASDKVANQCINADKYYTLEDDGYAKDWEAEYLWMNPPGRTVSEASPRKGGKLYSVAWYAKLFKAFYAAKVQNAIFMVYGVGRIGGLPYDMLQESVICLTAAGATSSIVHPTTGRINYDNVDESGERVATTGNTTSSAILLLSDNSLTCASFEREFKQYGPTFRNL